MKTRTLLVAALCALGTFRGFADKGNAKWYDRVFLGDGDAAAIGEKCRPVAEATNKLIRSLADGKDVLWLDFNAEWTPSGWAVPKDLMGDGTHPAEAGYALWFGHLDPILAKICNRRGLKRR